VQQAQSLRQLTVDLPTNTKLEPPRHPETDFWHKWGKSGDRLGGISMIGGCLPRVVRAIAWVMLGT
jgi:hypothetical protein